MAESADHVVDIVALADLFNNTVACFQSIQLGRGFDGSLGRHQLELDIVSLRLLRWGKFLILKGNYPDTRSFQRHIKSEATAKRIEALLGQILDSTRAGRPLNLINRMPFWDYSLVANDAQTPSDSAMSKLHETLHQLIIERQMQSGERQKAKRALYAKRQFRRLIKGITELLDSLDHEISAFFNPSQHELCDIVVAIIGESEGVSVLREIAADVDKMLECAFARTSDEADVKALHRAAFEGYLFSVQLLLDKGAKIDSQGTSDGNALYWASFRGHEHVVKLLLHHGADINASSEYGYSNSLQAASSQGHKDVVQILIDHGANICALGGNCGNALLAASSHGHHEIVQLLLDRGSDVEMRGGLHGTPLHAASHAGKQKVVECLLAAGADPNAYDVKSGGALYGASLAGHAKIVDLLLSAGGDVNASGGMYETALQAASYEGSAEVVEMLLSVGAAVNSSGGYYGQALQAACISGSEGIVKKLLCAGADMNAQGGHFGSALQAASSQGFQNLVSILLDAGANPHSSGGTHGSALQAALCGGHQEIAGILRTASTASELQAGLPDQTNPRQGCYRNVSQMLQETEHSGLGRSGVTMRFECEIMAVMSAQEFSKDRRSESWTKELLQNNVALVCSRSKSDGKEKIQKMRALTCIEHIESRWGSLGTRLLEDIAKLCTMRPRYQLQSGQ
jgi:ankyrin repeat protein